MLLPDKSNPHDPKEGIMKTLANLREWAASRHGDQRYGDDPYVTHLDEVAGVAEEFFPGDERLQQGAYGHDLKEDCQVTDEELLAAGFEPEAVADIEAVTDEDAPTREEKKSLTLPKTRARGVPAIKLKLCDRIANVRRGLKAPNRKLERYREEQAQFEHYLFDESHSELLPMWQHLRELLAA
jgi:guanosine-3',5'-bis(diphosphate) 3'-pyrophosphohydrolase